MQSLVLHRYDLSPFGEKVRLLALGPKGLAWRSVETPVWPPRPDTAPLAAGCRRSPVLRIGADVYRDALLVLRELERRFPEPALYPRARAALAAVLSWWADTATFVPAASIATSIVGDGVPPEFTEDRIAFMGRDFSKAASLRDLGLDRQRVAAQMGHLADMPRDGRAFLLGDGVSAADLSAYHPLWFVRVHAGAGAGADRLLPFSPAILAWMERVAALGHGGRSPVGAEEALGLARGAEPDDPSGLVAGDPAAIRADDANDPIRGVLVSADRRGIVIRHESPRAGIVHVHFPRFGYAAVLDGAPPAAAGRPEAA